MKFVKVPGVSICTTQNLLFIGALPQNISAQYKKKEKRIGGGTRVLVPGHQNFDAPYLPDWLYESVTSYFEMKFYNVQ